MVAFARQELGQASDPKPWSSLIPHGRGQTLRSFALIIYSVIFFAVIYVKMADVKADRRNR